MSDQQSPLPPPPPRPTDPHLFSAPAVTVPRVVGSRQVPGSAVSAPKAPGRGRQAMRPSRRPRAEAQAKKGDRDPASAPTPDGCTGPPPPIQSIRPGAEPGDRGGGGEPTSYHRSSSSSSAILRSPPPLRTRCCGASGRRITSGPKLRLGPQCPGILQGAAAKPTVQWYPLPRPRAARWPSPRTSPIRSPGLDVVARRLNPLLGSVGATSSPPKPPWAPSAAGFSEAQRHGAEH